MNVAIWAIVAFLMLIWIFLLVDLIKPFSFVKPRIDGYLDIVQEKDGATAMLIELENANVINKKTVKLEVRKSQKIQSL